MSLQKSASRTYILLVDKEAFRYGGLRVLYLDGFRDIVREGRIDPDVDDVFNVVSQ